MGLNNSVLFTCNLEIIASAKKYQLTQLGSLGSFPFFYPILPKKGNLWKVKYLNY